MQAVERKPPPRCIQAAAGSARLRILGEDGGLLLPAIRGALPGQRPARDPHLARARRLAHLGRPGLLLSATSTAVRCPAPRGVFLLCGFGLCLAGHHEASRPECSAGPGATGQHAEGPASYGGCAATCRRLSQGALLLECAA